MKLATKFLTTLEPDFEPDDITKAFGETNRLFLSQKILAMKTFLIY